MISLSVVIITKNEENNLPRCIASITFADEIIVIDSHSTDRTIDIAEELGAVVYLNDWRGYGSAKQDGVNRASGKWILSIDADEEISTDLASEIRSVISTNGNSTAGYNMPRKTRFLNRWIYHCGWYPDRVLRLFLRENGKFDEAVVHERVLVDGPVGKLHGEILHYSYPSLEEYFRKFNRYTTLGAQTAWKEGRRFSLLAMILSPFICFVKHYFIKRGFLDGLEGFIISVLSSCSVFVKYAKLRNLHCNNNNEEAPHR